MSGTGSFSVDLEALYAASLGLRRIFNEMQSHPVRDLDCPEDAFGHDELAEVAEDFCDRWQRGVKNLLADGEAIHNGLRDCLANYRRTDADVARILDQLYGR